MEAGRELDALVAEMMEPRASLPTITADEARLREWGKDREKWLWYSCHEIESPDGWWEAEIGTDHGESDKDHSPVRWRTRREPSDDIAVAWLVVEWMAERGWIVDVQNRQLTRWACHVSFPLPDARHVFETEDTAPLAICRAALKATEPTP
jgi:hypothetical protein